MSRKFVFLFFLVIVLFPAISKAQGLGNSPYSQIGIGDLINTMTLQNLGTGVSVANYNQSYVQLANPAASVNKKGIYNDSLIKLEGAGTFQYNMLTAPNATETNVGANFRYFALSVPIGKVWNTTISMQPFAVKDHSIAKNAPIQDDPNNGYSLYRYDGKGGIYQIAVNNGWGVSKNWSVGLGLNYLFGPATTITTSVLANNPNGTQTGIKRRVNHKALGIKPSLHYRKQFYVWKDSVLVPSGVYWNAGATVQVFTPMQLTINNYKVRRSSSGTVTEDSVLATTTEISNLPAQFTFGMSIDKPNRWMVGFEGGFSNWSNFEYATFTSNETYRLAWNIGVGGEIRPSTRYPWRSPTYRIGVAFAQLPYVISGHQLHDASASLGLTLPVGTTNVRGNGSSLPKINFALVAGQRGTVSMQAIQEFYVRMHISILIVDKWFTKRRIQ